MIGLEERRKVFSEKTKEWQPEPIQNFFLKMAEQYKTKDFFICENKTFTYGDILNAAKRMAVALKKLGVQNREHISLIFPNYAEFVIAKFGAAMVGGVTVSLNYRLKSNELKYLIQQSDSSYLITLDVWNNVNYITILKELAPEVFKGKESKTFPNLRKIIVFSPRNKKYPGTIDFYELIDSVEQEEAEKIYDKLIKENKDEVDTVTDIMYTSGTTSMPKGVLVTHDMLWRSAFGSCINRGYQEGRRIFVPIPFYHTFGYIEGIIAGMMVGGVIISQIKFDEAEALELIEKHQVQDVLCVPTIGLRLVEKQKEFNRNISSLMHMYCAGSEVSTKLWKEIKTILKLKELNTGYGMTETAAGSLQTDPLDDISYLNNYVGKTLPGGHVGLKELNGNNIEFRIRNIESDEFLPFGEQGELVCRGPMVTKGYYNKPDETKAAITVDGWLKTGDLAIMHENGYISLTGRLKEVYRIGAENVSPKEIEDVLTSHEKINQAYVMGVPDPVMGEVGMAWIVLEQGMEASEEEIREYASRKLARFKVPKYIKFVENVELPLTSSGKVQKSKLKELYLSEINQN